MLIHVPIALYPEDKLTKWKDHMTAVRLVAVRLLVLFPSLAGCSSPEQRAAAHYQRGIELLEDAEYEKATLEFKNAVKLKEDHAEAWYGLARVAEQQAQWQNYGALLTKVIELAPKHVDAHVRLAKLLLVNGDLERALSLANSADALKPSDADILALSGAILVRLNDIDGARAKAQTALALDAGNADAIAVIATDRMMAGQLRDALSQIETGIGRNPDNLGLLLFRLRILEQLGETRQFEAAVRHLSETYPAERAFQRMLVRFLMAQGRTDDAESELRKLAARIRRTRTTYWTSFASLHRSGGSRRRSRNWNLQFVRLQTPRPSSSLWRNFRYRDASSIAPRPCYARSRKRNPRPAWR